MHKTMLICSFFTNDDQTIRCDQMLLDLYIRSRTCRSRVCIWYFMNMVLIKIIAIFHKWCYWQTKGLWQTGTRPVNPTTQPAMFWNFKKVKIIDLVYNLISQAHGCVHESNKTMFLRVKRQVLPCTRIRNSFCNISKYFPLQILSEFANNLQHFPQ